MTLITLLVLGIDTQAQTPPDTLKGELEEITVVGYEGNRSIMQTPGSITYIPTATLSALQNNSLLYGLNQVAGVKMDERAPGSYRIAIRGSALRSPFGVRNVKIYWNNIPLTDPSGSTALNLLDNHNIKQVEVIKGPTGSMYGAGNGGVLLLNSFERNPVTARNGAVNVGEYGYLKYNGSYITKNDFGIFQYKYASQKTDGYREQGYFDRTTFESSAKIYTPNDIFVTISTLYTNLDYGIPGGLNAQQFEENPRQARAGSVEKESGVRQENFLFGVDMSTQWSENWSGGTTLFGNLSSFENPFLFDYKRDSRKSWGNRSQIVYNTQVGEVDLNLKGGAEVHRANHVARNFQNDAGQPDTLNFDDEIEIRNRTYYFKSEADLPNNVYLTFGLSVNSIRYDIYRVATNLDGDSPQRVKKDFDLEFIPRVAAAKQLNPNTTLHGSISWGFSPPTVEEIRTNEGSLNLGLKPEKGINYELGLRGRIPAKNFTYDAVVFWFILDETIVQLQSPRGTTLFENAGSTDQKGFELSTGWQIWNNPGAVLSQVQFNNSYTYHHFKFDEYNRRGNDYSGNDLTGVAPHTVNSELKIASATGLYNHWSLNYTDEIPLNDGNTVYSDPYTLVQVQLGYKTRLGDKFSFDIHGGIDNLLDEDYSRGYDVNAFGDRYFQPAPTMNWFAGFKFNYEL